MKLNNLCVVEITKQVVAQIAFVNLDIGFARNPHKIVQ